MWAGASGQASTRGVDLPAECAPVGADRGSAPMPHSPLLTTLRGRLQADVWETLTPSVPGWLGVVGLRHRAAHLVHDRVCRDLGLDPREICR